MLLTASAVNTLVYFPTEFWVAIIAIIVLLVLIFIEIIETKKRIEFFDKRFKETFAKEKK